jgi:hypothetical protein
MPTAHRPRYPQSSVERSRKGFKVCIAKRDRVLRFELTRKQAKALEERLNHELNRIEPPAATPPADDEWLEPQIM